jgi:hypothetical protein
VRGTPLSSTITCARGQREAGTQRAQRGAFERVAARETGADRHVRAHEHRDRLDGVTLLSQHLDAPEQVAREAPGRLFARAIDDVLGEIGGVKFEASAAAHGELDGRALGDRARQHVAVVVVGVLAEQVHTPGGRGASFGLVAENLSEARHAPALLRA